MINIFLRNYRLQYYIINIFYYSIILFYIYCIFSNDYFSHRFSVYFKIIYYASCKYEQTARKLVFKIFKFNIF